jgi:hypothetical protein
MLFVLVWDDSDSFFGGCACLRVVFLGRRNIFSIPKPTGVLLDIQLADGLVSHDDDTIFMKGIDGMKFSYDIATSCLNTFLSLCW